MRIILIAHGQVASSTLNSLEMILGPLEDMYAVDFSANESMDSLSKRLEACLDEAVSYIFCDIKGGTPFNVSYLLSKQHPIQIICGLNLGMLLDCLIKRAMDTPFSMLEAAEKAGKDAIEVFDLLRKEDSHEHHL